MYGKLRSAIRALIIHVFVAPVCHEGTAVFLDTPTQRAFDLVHRSSFLRSRLNPQPSVLSGQTDRMPGTSSQHGTCRRARWQWSCITLQSILPSSTRIRQLGSDRRVFHCPLAGLSSANRTKWTLGLSQVAMIANLHLVPSFLKTSRRPRDHPRVGGLHSPRSANPQ